MLLRSLLAFLAAVTLLPDEGQWLPTQVREMDWDALKKRGMVLSKDEFWHPEKGGVLSATVQINGCTASFCSAEGLLVTNHHCGFSAVSDLSTPQENLLRDGFAAKDRGAERPAPGMVAAVLQRIEDVTKVVHEAQAKAKDDLDRWSITQRTLQRLIAEAEAKEPNTKCSVASFLEGKEYHLYYRTQIRDVRLVYAPPRAIGEFGGETDNWEWPRHTGDFTFFRAYVAPDGAVREFHKDNVPYRPTHHLKVSTAGVVAGDLAIIMGYPGRTQRYKTSRAIATQEGYVYPRRLDVLTRAIAVLEAASKTDEALALQVADRIKSLANVQKNAAGMIFGLRNNATVAQKQHEEAQFQEWAGKSGDDGCKRVLAEMLAADEAEATTIERDTFVWVLNMLGDDVPVLGAMIEACSAVAMDPSGKVPPRLLDLLGTDQLMANFETIQKPLLAILIGELASQSKAQRVPGSEFLGGNGLDATAAEQVLGSALLAGAARRELFARGRDGVMQSDDALLRVAKALAAERLAANQRQRQRGGLALELGRRWIAAQEAFRGKAFYPDANSTLRVSIAEVAGYSPREAITYAPHTTVAGLLQKETGKEPFANPKALLAAAKDRAQSRWFDKRLQDVPVCFLTNGDTTGGNSGSPVVNGKGELIGLNFDRVFEAVAGDFGWNKDRSRNVVCDIRYVLWVVESVFPCASLLAELGA